METPVTSIPSPLPLPLPLRPLQRLLMIKRRPRRGRNPGEVLSQLPRCSAPPPLKEEHWLPPPEIPRVRPGGDDFPALLVVTEWCFLPLFTLGLDTPSCDPHEVIPAPCPHPRGFLPGHTSTDNWVFPPADCPYLLRQGIRLNPFKYFVSGINSHPELVDVLTGLGHVDCFVVGVGAVEDDLVVFRALGRGARPFEVADLGGCCPARLAVLMLVDGDEGGGVVFFVGGGVER